MIQQINLEGFKSFVSENIELGNLTLLTGLNSSGKSSIIQAILMLAESAQSQEILLDGHGDLSELKNSYTTKLEITAILENEITISINSENQRNKNEIINNYPTIIYIAADRFGPETTLPIYIGDNYKIGKKGENILKCIDFFDTTNTLIPSTLRHPNSEGDTFIYNLEAWLSVISPNTKFKHEIQRFTDTSFATFNGHRAKNVGFGLSYVLPVITALLVGSVTPNSLVIIENPEAHLHPRGQLEIARLIALCVEVGVQVIIETHSDHIFDGIRIYAKNSEIDFHEKVKIYWFELDEDNNTEVQSSNLDKNGRLDNYPKGFFDQFEINASKLL